MARKKKNNRISVGGLRPMPGQTKPNTIILSAPKRFLFRLAYNSGFLCKFVR